MNTKDLYAIYLQHPEICTDSRKVKPNSLFFALKGENFDGNQFAAQAVRNGCAFAIIDDKNVKRSSQYLLVDDVLKALQQLAKYHRQQFKIPFIGITGSNGKTTTKELCQTVLNSHFKTFATPGNYNNHIGVPLTLLSLPNNTEIAIIEMGANHQGEIHFLSQIAQPTHGLITNIGKAHLEGFGGVEGIKKGKSELYRYLAANNGLVFVNKNEKFLEELAASCHRKVFYGSDLYSSNNTETYSFQLLNSNPFVSLSYKDINNQQTIINSQLYGHYNYHNIITAVTLGLYFRVPLPKIKSAIEAYNPDNNRSQLLKKDSNTYILDAYNANPTSMYQAIESFSNINAPKKVIILGHMLELGEESEKEHQKLVEIIQTHGFEKIILVGSLYDTIALPDNILHFKDVSEAKEWFRKQTFEETYFLVKGSRGVKLEKLFS